MWLCPTSLLHYPTIPLRPQVPIPVRFLFVLLGPYHGEMDYHEVGRSISTLMSDKHFHEVAYRAHSRSQLLSAINEFLNASIVLPPSEWSNSDLIPVDQIREKAQEMVKRKETIRQKRLQTDPGKCYTLMTLFIVKYFLCSNINQICLAPHSTPPFSTSNTILLLPPPLSSDTPATNWRARTKGHAADPQEASSSRPLKEGWQTLLRCLHGPEAPYAALP